MKKPCKITAMELIEGNREKVTLYFRDLSSSCEIIIDRDSHSNLFCELIDFMKFNETFDFMDVDLRSNTQRNLGGRT